MMRTIWQRYAVVAVVVGLLGFAGRAQAGPAAAFCCACLCPSGTTCANVATPSDCPATCGADHENATACVFQVFPTACLSVPECPEQLGVPALRSSGLSAVTVFLVALGAWGVRRAARRKNS